MTLVLDVSLNHVIGNVSAAATEVPSSPKVPTPESFAQMRELVEQDVRATTLDALHQLANFDLRWNRHHQMNVIPGNMPLQNADVQLIADTPGDFSNPVPYGAREHRLPVLRNPHNVQVDSKDGVRAFSVISHGPLLTGALC